MKKRKKNEWVSEDSLVCIYDKNFATHVVAKMKIEYKPVVLEKFTVQKIIQEFNKTLGTIIVKELSNFENTN